MPAAKRRFYIPALDGLRAVAFLLVFFAHCGLDKVIPGGFGVTVFFFLSGYLITTLLRLEHRSRGSISLKNFYLHRARRILPPMYISLALCFLIARFARVADTGSLRGAISAVFYYFNYLELAGVPNLLPSGSGVLWSLMIEEHFYFVFPLIYLVFCRKAFSRYVQASLLAVACLLPLIWRFVLVFHFHTPLTTLPRWTYSASDARFDAILWGCVLAIACNPWFDDAAGILKRNKGRFAGAGLAVLFLSLAIRNPIFRETLRYSLQSVALFPIFYFVISTRSHWTSWLEWEPVKQLGQLSYAAYLIHFTLLSVAFSLFPRESRLITAPVCFLLTVLYAMLMRRFVERPLRKLVP
jgi:peptidoglycan/LPS O-acetylase OafA/YrhL